MNSDSLPRRKSDQELGITHRHQHVLLGGQHQRQDLVPGRKPGENFRSFFASVGTLVEAERGVNYAEDQAVSYSDHKEEKLGAWAVRAVNR